MSRAEDAFELDRLSTVVPSQEFTVLFFSPHKHLKILKGGKERIWGLQAEEFIQIIEILVSIV